MQSDLLIYPLFAQILLTVLLYALLTVFRAPVVWGVGLGGKTGGTAESKKGRHGESSWDIVGSKVSANLSNQFEWPTLFYAICILLMCQFQTLNPAFIGAAWLFVFGRVVHSGVQVFTNNIRLRGAVFTINFLAVLAMWLLYYLENT